eukprot:ANDGO_08538.mRNA.1 Kinesin-like protein KIN-5C
MAENPTTPRTARATEKIPVKVVVRCRPMNIKEAQSGSTQVVFAEADTHEVKIQQNIASKYVSKVYTFDEVFSSNSTQAEVYDRAVQPIVEEVLEGYNCTIFAYGQTSTGKTFTMEGERDLQDGRIVTEKSGVIFRAVNQIFNALGNDEVEYTVRVSCLELYNEELADLLSPDYETKRLRIYEDPRKGTTVSNMEEVPVQTSADILLAIESANRRRQVAETQLNRNSSRSHVITTITIHIKEATPDGEDVVRTGKLNLVDLAGSENIGRSGAIEKRAKEAGMINQSLLTLGRVITALTEHSPHIPYRESKLTRLLQESLGGRAKTCIIATISPASINIDETMSTLDYANRAKSIKNRPEVNQKMTKRALIKEMAAEIESLKAELAANREKNGVYLPHDKFVQLEASLSFRGQRLGEIEQQISDKEKEFAELQALFKARETELSNERSTHAATRAELSATVSTLQATSSELTETKKTLDKKEYILDEYTDTEDKLFAEADALLGKLKNALGDNSGLFSKIERKARVEQSNQKKIEDFSASVDGMLFHLGDSVRTFEDASQSRMAAVGHSLDAWSVSQNRQLSVLSDAMCTFEQTAFGANDRIVSIASQFASQVMDNTHPSFVEMQAMFVGQMEKAVHGMVDAFRQSLSNVIAEVSVLSGSMESLRTSCVSNISSLDSAVGSFVEDQSQQLEQLAKMVSEDSASAIEMIRERDAELERSSVKQLEMAAAAKDALLTTLMSSVNAHFEQQAAAMTKSRSAVSETLSSVSGRWSTVVEKISADIDVAKNTVQDFAGSFTASKSEAISSLSASVSATQATAGDIARRVEASSFEMAAAGSSIVELSNNYESQFQKRMGDASIEVRVFLDMVRENSEVSRQAIQDFKTEQMSLCSEFSSTAFESVEVSKKSVEEATVGVREHCAQSTARISDVRTAVDRFRSGVEKDVPTGLTPIKRDVAVPETLPKTRPTEEIVAEWAQSKLSSPAPCAETEVQQPMLTVETVPALGQRNQNVSRSHGVSPKTATAPSVPALALNKENVA